jgi:hypothetical protein
VFLLPAQRAHVVQPIRQLDDQHAQILDAGQHHLAQRLRLLVADRLVGLAPLLLDLLELGDAVHQLGDGCAKVCADVVDAVVGVLGDVVQQPRGNRLRVHAQLGEQLRHGYRVGNVGFAAFPRHAAVRVAGKHIGAQDQIAAVLFETFGQVAPERLDGEPFLWPWVAEQMSGAVHRRQRAQPVDLRPQRVGLRVVAGSRHPGAGDGEHTVHIAVHRAGCRRCGRGRGRRGRHRHFGARRHADFFARYAGAPTRAAGICWPERF